MKVNSLGPFKIGVTKNNNRDYSYCSFSDFDDGFAYFTKGFTRNGSLDSGYFYGKKFESDTTNYNIKMTLNMGKGNLSFVVNGEDFGIAF